LNNIAIENMWKNVMLLSRLAKMSFEHIANAYVENGAIEMNDPNEGIETCLFV
jgi:hypothetical protein